MKTKVLRVIIFFLIILTIPIFTLFGQKEKVSFNENRMLAELPEFTYDSWKNRSFMTGMSDYFSDHFVHREDFIKIKNTLEKIIGKNEINGVFEFEGNLIQTFKDVDYSLTDRNINSLNKLKEKNPSVPFYFMPVITAQEFFKNDLPEYLDLDSESKYINYCFSKLNNIETIDVSREICDTEYAFYRTDHHWTTSSAYKAYLKFAEHLSFIPDSSPEFITVTNEFKGTLYSKTLNESIEPDSIKAYISDSELRLKIKDAEYNSIYFEEYLTEKDKYSYFLSGNHGFCTVYNKSMSDNKKLLIIKDSYANCFVPFIAEHYSEITLVDPRYCSFTEIKTVNPSEYDAVLVLFNILGFSQEQNFSLIEFMGESK